jgi:hypothetical protein
MGRKVFQGFAYVLCQKFVNSSSNRDLVNLAILGSGKLVLFITEGQATHNGHAVEPLPFGEDWLAWVAARMAALRISREDMKSARLEAECDVEMGRSDGLGWLYIKLKVACTGVVESSDRTYVATCHGNLTYGLGSV